MFLGHNTLLTFQQDPGDVWDPIRQRIQVKGSRLRASDASFLAYSLLDQVVDNYFIVLENLGELIEFLEEDLIRKPDKSTLQSIHHLKGEMIYLRKSVWPLREMIGGLARSDSPLIREPSLLYFRDVYDHTIQVIDTIETYRETVSGMIDIYLSSVSNRMNEVMKVLTIIATIFMPLTFLAGVYGMNFKFMPELDWRYGYIVVWGVMVLIGAAMVIVFKKKKWM